MTNTRVMLVYQAGIANLFKVDSFNLSDYGRNAERLYQGDFRTAENIAYGMGLMGATVHTAHCNQAGDISGARWSENLDAAPFSDKFRPVTMSDGKRWNGYE